jgi:hypothetical protein
MASERSPLLRAVLTGVAAAVLVFPALATVGGRQAWWVLLGLFVGITVLVAGGVMYRQRSDASESDGDSVWNAIPGWQYDGRHVESGGLTRGEQEQALQEIQQRAESESGRSR